MKDYPFTLEYTGTEKHYLNWWKGCHEPEHYRVFTVKTLHASDTR